MSHLSPHWRQAPSHTVRFIALAIVVAVLSGEPASLSAQNSGNEAPVSAQELRELRSLVRELVARDARIEAELAQVKAELRERQASQLRVDRAKSGGPVVPGDFSDGADAPSTTMTRSEAPSSTQANAAQPTPTTSVVAPLADADRSALDFLKGNTINFAFDGYYAYNFNHPYGRVNYLRAYDVMSNAFSLNQASLIFEHAPDVSAGKRFGMRLDLQFGQATETLQGNSANELRPNVYRSIFQAYGTYVAPVGRGLTVDFGKWASALGFENNYTKDQINYSRSYWFNFLPFYHMGVRSTYQFNDKFGASYWVVNGAQQTEPFNAFKGQFFGLSITPRKTISWNVNYFLGQDHPDVQQSANAGPVPVQPGLNLIPIRPAPDGRVHIVDSYISWQKTPKLTLALEADYVIQRLWRNAGPGRSSAPSEVWGGAAYAKYQLTPRVALGGRAEYMSDRQGAFSGAGQALKETTATFDYKIAEGFLMRYEWRRDFSNQPYFQADTVAAPDRKQNTATVGLVWWFGKKEGVW